MNYTKENYKKLYKALKLAKIVIDELLYKDPNSYQYQQDIIQNALDVAEE